MITRPVKLYLTERCPVRIPVSQFDTAWQFVFTVVKDSVTWTIPTGASAVLNGLKPDGNVFAFAGTISGNTVTVNCDVQMTAVAGDTICELSILADGKTVGTANFVLAVEAAPKSPDDVSSDSTLPAYAEMLEMFSGDIEDEVDSWLNAHSSQIGGLTNEAKQALLTLLAHVAYADDQGQTYLDALEAALYPPSDLVSISAVFSQGSATIYDTDSLDTLKQYLTVTALYSDSSTEVVTTYTLSGTLTAGTSTITVSYSGKTTTFNVTVTHNSMVVYNNFETVSGEYVPGNISGGYVIQQDANYSRTVFVPTQGASEIETPASITGGDTTVGFWVSNDPASNLLTRAQLLDVSDRQTVAVGYGAHYFVISAKTAALTEFLSGDFYGTKNRAVEGWTNGVAYAPFELVANEYIKVGQDAPAAYTGWSRTKFIDCHGASSISFAALTSSTSNNKYNAFYDEYFTKLSTFTLSGSTKTVEVPEGAYYFVVSGANADMANFVAGSTVPSGE